MQHDVPRAIRVHAKRAFNFSHLIVFCARLRAHRRDYDFDDCNFLRRAGVDELYNYGRRYKKFVEVWCVGCEGFIFADDIDVNRCRVVC